jgi:hypothetical protein
MSKTVMVHCKAGQLILNGGDMRRDFEKFNGTLQHPSGDYMVVRLGMVIDRVGPNHPRFNEVQAGYLSAQDETQQALTIDDIVPPMRQPGEREVASSSNEPGDGPNFRGPLSETSIQRTPFAGNTMVESQAIENQGYEFDTTYTDMVDPSAKGDSGAPQEEPSSRQVRNQRRQTQLPQYEMELPSEGMFDPSARG